MSAEPTTNLERQIRSQPEVLDGLIRSARLREQAHVAAEGLHRARRIWIIGTGTSLHAAELGVAMLQFAGRQAQAMPSMQFVDFAPVIGPQDAVIVITHSAETAFALSARAQAFAAGLGLVMITRQGSGFPEAIETVEKETAETYTVSYTAALVALAVLANELGADELGPDVLSRIPSAVGAAVDDPGIAAMALPERLLAFVGAGPAAVSAREGALKVREGARFLAEGFDAEYLLHGSAVPLRANDHLIALMPPDPSGLVEAVARAAEAEGVPTTRLVESADLPPLLAQIPLTARLQLLALGVAQFRGQDPDRVIVGAWADPGLWAIGGPPGAAGATT
jgi:glucosamine--fructose-6-phosphate aminotransferase (isomerizing)